MSQQDFKGFANIKSLREHVDEGTIPDAPESIEKLVLQFDRRQLEMGMDVEQEHNGGKDLDVVKTPLDTLKIVLAHLKEDPQYYTHLTKMEKENKVKQEGTTSRDSFRYDKSATNTYRAPEMNPRHFAAEPMDSDTDIDIDDPDPQFANDKPRTRTESDQNMNKKLKRGQKLLWDEDDEDMETLEVKECLHMNMKVNYGNDRYNIVGMDESNVILQNIRGIQVVLEIGDIRGVTADNTIITEIDEERLGEVLVRMIRAMKGVK